MIPIHSFRSAGRNNQAASRILVVDDEPMIRTLIRDWLTNEGHECHTAGNGKEAQYLLVQVPFDVMISDINMPVMDGNALLADVHTKYPTLAVLIATGIDDRQTAVRCLRAGAYGYLVKPLDKNEVLISVASALERRRLLLESRHYQSRLEREVYEQTAQIRFREEEIVTRLVTASEFRDNETGAHIRRIGLYSAALAEQLQWSRRDIDEIRFAAMMHDVGKIGIPDHILLKPGKLTPQEMEIMKTHTTIGASILGQSSIPVLRLARTIALHHHERWDGAGYPSGLAGLDIPICARIVAVADTYDALVHQRVYKPAFPEDIAIDMMKAERGKQFDPDLFETFLDVLPQFTRIRLDLASDGHLSDHQRRPMDACEHVTC